MSEIQDYALLGDCRSAALVSRAGSIDWLCWPRFDSPSLFAAVLDSHLGGRFTITPRGPHRARRRYLPGTNVLETRFTCETGVATLTDAMNIGDESRRPPRLLPEHEIVRLAACERGEVELEIVFDPRPDYGRGLPEIVPVGRLGMRVNAGRGVVFLRSQADLGPREDGGLQGRVVLRAGERLAFSLVWASDGPAVLPPLGDYTGETLAHVAAAWRRFADHVVYSGPHRDAVVRSALVLKLLGYAPSGAIIAAPTTSLPERVGGPFNWDYRFCWLRDAAFTARALFGLGFVAEADSFVGWLLHATRLTRPTLRTLYDVYGNPPIRETELPHLLGYHDSRPVRIGNAASDQLQLDVYGEVIDAATHFVGTGGRLDHATSRLLVQLGNWVCDHWRDRDQGIWELRDTRACFTHSRVLCWVALDRLLAGHEAGQLIVPAARFAAEREHIRHAVETQAWNERLGSYVDRFGGTDVDASLLLLPWYGFVPADSPRMRATYARVRAELGCPGGLLYRNRLFEAAGEGAFGIASFWEVEYLAKGGGSLAQAERVFENALAHANDLGLLAEEIEPASGAALGNFPQGYTHVGLINAALSLDERRAEGRA